MQDKVCELRLPGGKVVQFTYGKLKLGIATICLGLVGAVAVAGYFYYQLADYRKEASEFAEYKEHKKEQESKLEKLLQDNEKMLRDMGELSNLEKKLRRAIIRDVDSSKLGTGVSGIVDTESGGGYYNGKGSNGRMDVSSTMKVLAARNENMRVMIDETKKSVSELLGEIEGRSGTLATFPDRWPTDGGVISSNYGGRVDPINKDFEYHQGLDIAVDFGAPVYATAAGTVEQAGWNGGYGRYVRIKHGNGYETAYGHMSGIAVSAGQQVIKGEIIGFVGSSGYSTGPHLHYEVVADGQNVDPYYVLKRSK